MKQIWIPILLLPTLTVANVTFAQTTPAKVEQKVSKKYTQSEIFELVKKELKEGAYSLQKHSISLQSSFSKDLGLDSLDVVEFIMNMEKAFDIWIPGEMLEKMTTVQDAVRLIDGILKKQK